MLSKIVTGIFSLLAVGFLIFFTLFFFASWADADNGSRKNTMTDKLIFNVFGLKPKPIPIPTPTPTPSKQGTE